MSLSGCRTTPRVRLAGDVSALCQAFIGPGKRFFECGIPSNVPFMRVAPGEPRAAVLQFRAII